MRSVRKTLEERKKEYRIIYEVLYNDYRINVKNVASLLDSDRHSTSNRLAEAFDLGYVSKPQTRKRSYQNLKEYLYFVRDDNPLDAFELYTRCEDVMYQAVLGGPVTIMIQTREEMNVRGDVFLAGVRSDYFVSLAPDLTWDEAFKKIHRKIEKFDPEMYKFQGKIENHWNESVEWDREDEKLFSAFQYDLRKKLTPIMKENLISGEKIYKWFNRLDETCTVFTQFFPEGVTAYEPCLCMMDTDYEDFIVDLFSQFPTSVMFFKVRNTLFCHLWVKKSHLRVQTPLKSVEELEIPFIFRTLQKKKYVSKWWYSSIQYHYCR